MKGDPKDQQKKHKFPTFPAIQHAGSNLWKQMKAVSKHCGREPPPPQNSLTGRKKGLRFLSSLEEAKVHPQLAWITALLQLILSYGRQVSQIQDVHKTAPNMFALWSLFLDVMHVMYVLISAC